MYQITDRITTILSGAAVKFPNAVLKIGTVCDINCVAMNLLLRFVFTVCVLCVCLCGCHRPQRTENKNIDPNFTGFYCPGCKQGIVLE